MKIELLKPSYEIIEIESYAEMLNRVDKAARICYKSESKGNPEDFIRKLLKSGHHSPIEHASISVKFVVERGVSHELVRHRLASFSQESQRYVNYSGKCQFIIPPWLDIGPGYYEYTEHDGMIIFHNDSHTVLEYQKDTYLFILSIWKAAKYYTHARSVLNWSPQQARTVLPNAAKTELIITANNREWRHILQLRSAKNCHPQMLQIIQPLKNEMAMKYPAFFDDLATPIL